MKTAPAFLALFSILILAQPVTAGLPNKVCIPDPSRSGADLVELDFSDCNDADLVWCPGGDMDLIAVRATVRDAFESPCPDSPVTLAWTAVGEPQDELGIASTGICGPLSQVEFSDANGVVEFLLTGGGCGRIAIAWTVTADFGILLEDEFDTLCVKSPDFNGSLSINFFDTFKYLPLLNGNSGYCGNLNCDAVGSVNFFDTFVYLPHLQGAHQCTGTSLPSALLGDCP